MSKQTEQTARKDVRTAGKTATKSNSRIDRWRKLAEERIAWLAKSTELSGLAMLQACAEIEGMSPADLIMERLICARAGGRIVEERPKDCFSPMYNAFIDTDYERNMSTRARNNHERAVVASMVWDFAQAAWIPRDLVKRYGVQFVRSYYHKGDKGLFAAFHRMATSALSGLGGAAAGVSIGMRRR